MKQKPTAAIDLGLNPIHLGLGATAVVQPDFDGEMSWYQGYGERHRSDGAEGRLVAMHAFSSSWTSWECHPRGHEVVIVTAGRIVMIQEVDGAEVRTEVSAGQAVVNEPGVWHTTDVLEPGSAIFITAGEGTEHRPR